VHGRSNPAAYIPHAEKTRTIRRVLFWRLVALASRYQRGEGLIAIKLSFDSFGQSVALKEYACNWFSRPASCITILRNVQLPAGPDRHLWASPAPDGRIDRLLTGEEATEADLLLEQTRKEPMSPMLVLSCRAQSVCGGRRFAPMPERLLPFPMAELTVATDGSCKWCLPAQRLDQLDCFWHLGDFDVAAKCGSADASAERRNDKEQSRLPLPVR
jgi:hypothetical protein